MKTKTQLLIDRLISIGFKAVNSTAKHKAYKHPNDEGLLFVSSKATMRYGINKTKSRSILNPDNFLTRLENTQ